MDTNMNMHTKQDVCFEIKNIRSLLDDISEKRFNLIEKLNIIPMAEDVLINKITSHPDFKIIESGDGKLSTVENKNNITDWGKNNTGFPFHLDGGYYLKVPNYVILYCVRPSIIGGNTFFAKAEDIISKIDNKYENSFLNALNIIWIANDKQIYRRKLIEQVEGGRQLNWFSSLYIEADSKLISSKHRRFLTKFIKELMHDIEYHLENNIFLSHKWEQGDLVLFNNQLLLHGRDEISSDSNRLLFRIWFDKKDFLTIKNPIIQ